MAVNTANTRPIYTNAANITPASWLSSTTANVKSDGTGTVGTDMLKVVTGGTDGTRIEKLRFCPTASTAATATTASMIRVFYSTVGSGATTNANTFLIAEVPAPAQTADQTTTATNYIEIPLGLVITSAGFIHFSMHHAAAANTAWQCIPFATNY